MEPYQAVKEFLRRQAKDRKLQAVFGCCNISTVGDGPSRTLHFTKETLRLIDGILIEQDKRDVSASSLPCEVDEEISFSSGDIIRPPELCVTELNDINQFMNNTCYHNSYVQQVYRECGLQQLEETVTQYLLSSGWNTEMKQKCLEKFIKNLQKQHYSETVSDNHVDQMKVFESIRKFLTGLDNTAESRSAADYITTACGYKNDLSSRRLAKIIGANNSETGARLGQTALGKYFCTCTAICQNQIQR